MDHAHRADVEQLFLGRRANPRWQTGINCSRSSVQEDGRITHPLALADTQIWASGRHKTQDEGRRRSVQLGTAILRQFMILPCQLLASATSLEQMTPNRVNKDTRGFPPFTGFSFSPSAPQVPPTGKGRPSLHQKTPRAVKFNALLKSDYKRTLFLQDLWPRNILLQENVHEISEVPSTWPDFCQVRSKTRFVPLRLCKPIVIKPSARRPKPVISQCWQPIRN